MMAESNFVQALTDIGERLIHYTSKDIRRTQLYAELALLNLNLPARVYLPLSLDVGTPIGKYSTYMYNVYYMY